MRVSCFKLSSVDIYSDKISYYSRSGKYAEYTFSIFKSTIKIIKRKQQKQ